MNQTFINRFLANKQAIIDKYASVDKYDVSYDSLVKDAIERITDENEYDMIDPSRITVIDYGDYQGNKLYIIAGRAYQTSTYWYVLVDYGSCSGCDTLEAIRMGIDSEYASDIYNLMLQIVESIKPIGGEETK